MRSRSPSIPAIADKLSELARRHHIGELQAIRKTLKKLKIQPGTKIFNTQSTFDDYAYHYGGRAELQFNIGHADDGYYNLRHGVAFSFELSGMDFIRPELGFLVSDNSIYNLRSS